MTLTIDDLVNLHPSQIFLECSTEEKTQIWTQTLTYGYPNEGARRNAYLNRLCAHAFLQYMEDDGAINHDSGISPQLWPTLSEGHTVWSWVTGTAIDVGETRFVLFPLEHTDPEELRVPREWVELPDWVGNYYLAANINVDAGWIQILGYATYAEMKTQGQYDSVDETYCLQGDELSEELSTLWVSYDICPQSRPVVPPLPVATTQAIGQMQPSGSLISSTPFFFQRLAFPFHQRGTVLSSEQGRQSLYDHLMEWVSGKMTLSDEPVPSSENQPQDNQLQQSEVVYLTPATHANLAEEYVLVNLRQWFQNTFNAGWRALDSVINPEENRLAFSFRQGRDSVREITIEGVKLIDLGVQLGCHPIALVIGLGEQADHRINVRIQLLPTGGDAYLPAHLMLTLLSQSGSILQTLTSRTRDNLMQLKQFICAEGSRFSIRLELGDIQFTETFTVAVSSAP